jgi:hypothetical protein
LAILGQNFQPRITRIPLIPLRRSGCEGWIGIFEFVLIARVDLRNLWLIIHRHPYANQQKYSDGWFTFGRLALGRIEKHAASRITEK